MSLKVPPVVECAKCGHRMNTRDYLSHLPPRTPEAKITRVFGYHPAVLHCVCDHYMVFTSFGSVSKG